MHEYHLVEALVRDVVAQAEQQNAHRIQKITIAMGDHAGLSEESIRLYFETCSEGTIAHEAELTFRIIPTQFICSSCQRPIENTKISPSKLSSCPYCGSPTIRPLKLSKDFFVEHIEI